MIAHKNDVSIVERQFFPLDEQLGLMSGGYSPQVQEAMTRLGARMNYKEAKEEMKLLWGVAGCKATVANTTMRHGHYNLAVEEAILKKVEKEGRVQSRFQEVAPEKLVVSIDGAMVATKKEWREVKLMTIGKFEGEFDRKKGDVRAKSESLSYFARMEPSETFEKSITAEWLRRGGEEAEMIVAVNDGAKWIQSVIDYQCPKAIRVIDYAHAQGCLGRIGKLVYKEGSKDFQQWYERMNKMLGKESPQKTLNELRFFQKKQVDEEIQTEIDKEIHYLERREEMIDYPRFRRMQIPIGSGCVESGHKVVMQKRMKQAGMKWSENNVNAMLSLRMAICNNRWDESWKAISQQARQPKPKSVLSEESVPELKDVDSRIVSHSDIKRLKKMIKQRKGQKWRNHDWIFPHRRNAIHRN